MIDVTPAPSSLLKTLTTVARWSLGLLLTAWFVFGAAWGALHWLIVPRIGEFRPQLEARATQVLGVPVRIGAIAAHSTGMIPSFELTNVRLFDAQGREALRLPRVLAALSPRSLWHLGFEQLYVDRPKLNIRRAMDGKILVAGLDFSKNGDTGNECSETGFFRRSSLPFMRALSSGLMNCARPQRWRCNRSIWWYATAGVDMTCAWMPHLPRFGVSDSVCGACFVSPCYRAAMGIGRIGTASSTPHCHGLICQSCGAMPRLASICSRATVPLAPGSMSARDKWWAPRPMLPWRR